MSQEKVYADKDYLEMRLLRLCIPQDMEKGWTFYGEEGQYKAVEDIIVPFTNAQIKNYGYRDYSFLHYIIVNDYLCPYLESYIHYYNPPLNEICDDRVEANYDRYIRRYIEMQYGTPIQMAVRTSNAHAVKILAGTEGVNCDVTGDLLYGRTIIANNNLLHLAVYAALLKNKPNMEEIISFLLLEAGFVEMINQENKENQTPFQMVLAFHDKNPALADRLIAQMLYCGADIFSNSYKGKYVIDYACISDRSNYLTQRIYDAFMQQYMSVDGKAITNISQLYYVDRLEHVSPAFRQQAQDLATYDIERIEPTGVQCSTVNFKFKSTNIPFGNNIPMALGHIAQQHNLGAQSNSSNYIIAGITVITSSGPYQHRGDRKTTTFLLGGEQELYKCNSSDDVFTGAMAYRLLEVNARSSSDYMRLLQNRDKLYEKEFGDGYTASAFHSKFMHSETALLNHIETPEFIQTLVTIFTENGIAFGTKIYGMLLDIVSTKELCNNACDDGLVALQNSRLRSNGFLSLFQPFIGTGEPETFYSKKDFALQVRFSYFNQRHKIYPAEEHEAPLNVNPRETQALRYLALNPIGQINEAPDVPFIRFGTYCPTIFRSGSKDETTDKVTFATPDDEKEPPAKRIKARSSESSVDEQLPLVPMSGIEPPTY